ncbi:AraC family transcriptional regulator [Chryseolinea sp. T2]|uniref:AraC family transcriptional regulator n=1 Tax=Chryseolinea sp. T2 TaxID=3129255 RepID=UPI003076E411
MQFQISILRGLIYGAVDHGADLNELCRRVGVTPEQLNNGEEMVDWQPDPSRDFWTNAVEMTRDPLLGLHLGVHESAANNFGLLGMLARSCRTVGEAVRTICQYNETISTVVKYGFEYEGDYAIFTMQPVTLWEQYNESSARQAAEISLSSFCQAFRSLTFNRAIPVRVEIKYSEREKNEYERVLRAPVVFGASRNALVMRRRDMDLELTSHDESLRNVFESLLTAKRTMMREKTGLVYRIRQLLVEEFRGQIPTIEEISSQLSMTPRTLQRKLAEQGTSFRTVSLQFRKDLAEQLFKAGTARKQRVASMLGYADADTLRRAIKASGAV